MQMEALDQAGTFTWQRLGDEGNIRVVGKWADPKVNVVHETEPH